MRESKPQLKLQNIAGNRIAIIVAEWNSEYNDLMLEEAVNCLQEAGLEDEDLTIVRVPGAFEIPVTALRLADSGDFAAIICFATVVKGNTYHFEIVANESARGLMQVSLETEIPVINGILTCNTSEQAEFRASPEKENKGREMALSAIQMINCFASDL